MVGRGDSTPGNHRYTIGPYEPGDEEEILRLFSKVFRIERSREHWAWKFLDNPEGTHIYLGKRPSGEVVSQYAAVPIRMHCSGRTCVFGLVLDSMADQECRRGLRKPGVFVDMCNRFVDHYGRSDREIVMYGLPSPEAFRVGRRLLGYTHLHDLHILSKDLRPSGAPAKTPGIRVEVKERFSDDLDDLWDRCKDDFTLAAVRDSRYMSWRYTRRPDVSYYVIEARSDADQELLGVGVLGPNFVSPDMAVIADLLLSREHPEAGRAIVGRCETLTGDAGLKRLQFLVPGYRWEHELFTEMAYSSEETPFFLVARTYATELALEWAAENWYYTLGDFDFA